MPIELPKIPYLREPKPAAAERNALPFSSFPEPGVRLPDQGAIAHATQVSQEMRGFLDNLNRRNILRLRKHPRSKEFDSAAAVLEGSVYKPIQLDKRK